MKVKEIVEKLNLEVVIEADLNKKVTGGYTGDLLSNVMAKAKAGNLWITIQSHQNVIAVALLVEISAVIIAEDSSVDDKAKERAKQKGINILRSQDNAYQIAGKMFKEGID